MNRDQYTCARHVSCDEALVPVHARNRDECPLNNRDEWPTGPVRGPGLKNRDECISFVRVCGTTGMNALIGSGRKVQFLVVCKNNNTRIKLDLDQVLVYHVDREFH